MGKAKVKLTPENIRDIETVLSCDQTAEVKPTPSGVKVSFIQRKEVKSETALKSGFCIG